MNGKHSGSFVVWAALGCVMALVMPLTAVYTAMSVQVVADDSAPLIMLAILAIISFAAHVLVLFGGKLAHDAKTYYLFNTKHTRLSNQLAADHRLVRKRLKKLQLLFIPYVHHWKKHNSTYAWRPGRSTTKSPNSCAATSRTSTRTRTATTAPTTSSGLRTQSNTNGRAARLARFVSEDNVTMYGEIIRLLIAAACALFVLSLPLSKTESGAALRRWAGVCFILAFLPSLIIGVFYVPSAADSAATGTPATAARAHDLLSGLGCIAAVIITAFIAYGVLKLRSRFAAKAKPRDPWETFFNRGGGKRPFTMSANARRSRGPFGFTDDDEDED